jgi:hypothetical protein
LAGITQKWKLWNQRSPMNMKRTGGAIAYRTKFENPKV